VSDYSPIGPPGIEWDDERHCWTINGKTWDEALNEQFERSAKKMGVQSGRDNAASK